MDIDQDPPDRASDAGSDEVVFYRPPKKRAEDDPDELNIGPAAIPTDFPGRAAPVVENVDNANPGTLWSLFMRLGTEASNQSFFLIHEHLQGVLRSVSNSDG